MPTPVLRRAGRVLLVDAERRVLLFRGGDPHAPERGTWWFTPGGGLDGEESWAEGAARELYEETGLAVRADDLGSAVHAERTEFDFAGTTYSQDSRFFLHRVDRHDVDTSRFEELEASSIVEHRWWSFDELRRTSDAVYPPRLAEILTRLEV